jgi:hypothetical protein
VNNQVSTQTWHIGLSGGAPDSVRCVRLVNGEVASLGNRRSCTTIIHRTVRWCTGLSSESSATNSPLSGNGKGDVAIIHRTVRWCTGQSGGALDSPVVHWTVRWCTGQSGGALDSPVSQRSPAPTVGRVICGRHVDCSNGQLMHQTVRCAPDSVRCANGPGGAMVGCA